MSKNSYQGLAPKTIQDYNAGLIDFELTDFGFKIQGLPNLSDSTILAYIDGRTIETTTEFVFIDTSLAVKRISIKRDKINLARTTALLMSYFDVLSNIGNQSPGSSGDMLKSVFDTDNSGIVDNAEKLGGQVPSFYASQAAVTSSLATKENTITAGTTLQYYRGDKTFATLDKTAVGLANVENTTDLNKPLSSATIASLAGKESAITVLPIAKGGTNLSTLGAAGQVLTVNPGATALVYTTPSSGTKGINPTAEFNASTQQVTVTNNSTIITIGALPVASATLEGVALEVKTAGLIGNIQYNIGDFIFCENTGSGWLWRKWVNKTDFNLIVSATQFDVTPPIIGDYQNSTGNDITLTGGQIIRAGARYSWNGTSWSLISLAPVKDIGKITTLADEIFADGTVPASYTDVATGIWSATPYSLRGTSTSLTGFTNNILLRPTIEADLNQQVYVERQFGLSTQAILGSVVRYQTNGDHYVAYLVWVSATVCNLEVAKVISSTKTLLFPAIPINTTGAGTPTILPHVFSDSNRYSVEFIALSSNSTFLKIRVTDTASGQVVINKVWEDTATNTPTLQTAGRCGLSVWRQNAGLVAATNYDVASTSRLIINKIENLVNVLFVGDSKTFGTGALVSTDRQTISGTVYPAYTIESLGDAFIGTNIGIGGRRLDSMAGSAATDSALYYRPGMINVCAILGGTNDALQNNKFNGLYQDLVNVSTTLKNLGWWSTVLTVDKVQNNGYKYSGNSELNRFNQKVRNNYNQFANSLSDIAAIPQLSRYGAELLTDYYVEDGIHNNSWGQYLIGQCTANAINTIFTGENVGNIIDPIERQPSMIDVDLLVAIVDDPLVFTYDTNIANPTFGSIIGFPTVDGVVLTVGKKLLKTSQTLTKENGVYVVTAVGLKRLYKTQPLNQLVNITNGSTATDQVWRIMNKSPITLGTTNQTWRYFYKFSGSRITMQNGLLETYIVNPTLTDLNFGTLGPIGNRERIAAVAINPGVNFTAELAASTTLDDSLDVTIFDQLGVAGSVSPNASITIQSSQPGSGTINITAGSTTVTAVTANLFVNGNGLGVGMYLKVGNERRRITAIAAFPSATLTIDTAFTTTNANASFSQQMDILTSSGAVASVPLKQKYGSKTFKFLKSQLKWLDLTPQIEEEVPLVSVDFSALTAANNTILTVPANKTLVVNRVEIRRKNITGTVTTSPSISIGGTPTTFDDYLANTSMTGVTATDAYKFSKTGVVSDYPALTTLTAKVNIAQMGATVLDYTVNVYGIIR